MEVNEQMVLMVIETALLLTNRTESNTHFSGRCHKRCRNQFKSVEQAQNKKLSPDLVLSKRMITFAPDDESLKRLVAQHRVFIECSL